jgi:hypothetical protein
MNGTIRTSAGGFSRLPGAVQAEPLSRLGDAVDAAGGSLVMATPR